MDIDKLEQIAKNKYAAEFNNITYLDAFESYPAMLQLIDECYHRDWQFEYVKDDAERLYFHMVLGNEDKVVYNDDDAAKLLAEIRTYW